jgi:hypothetical protein
MLKTTRGALCNARLAQNNAGGALLEATQGALLKATQGAWLKTKTQGALGFVQSKARGAYSKQREDG